MFLLLTYTLLLIFQFTSLTVHAVYPNSPTLPSLACVDTLISTYLRESGHNAASFSVMRNGTIAYSQGFGLASLASTHHNFRQVGSDGWCKNAQGNDGKSFYIFNGRLSFNGAMAICNYDPSCVAFSYKRDTSNPDRILGLFYSSKAKCELMRGAYCDDDSWSSNPSLIVGSSGDQGWTCQVKGGINASKSDKKAFNSTPFRWGSISKTVTAAAFMVLVQKGLVTLNTFAFRCDNVSIGPLAHLAFNTQNCIPKFVLGDPRIQNITMRHLLQHTSGWDPVAIQHANFMRHYNVSQPSVYFCREMCTDIVEFMLSQPLRFTPGTQYSYSNPGYCAAGLAIQSLFSTSISDSRVSYEDAVRAILLNPAGISKNEMYLKPPDSSIAEAVSSCNVSVNPLCWAGAWDCLFEQDPSLMERWGPHGGWIATATAMMKLMRVITAPYCTYSAFGCLLNATSRASMLAPPPGISVDPYYWYGLGIDVMASSLSSTSVDSRHGGAMPGTSATFYRYADWHKPGWYAVAMSVYHPNPDFTGTIDSMNPLLSRVLDCVNDSTWQLIAEDGSVSGDNSVNRSVTRLISGASSSPNVTQSVNISSQPSRSIVNISSQPSSSNALPITIHFLVIFSNFITIFFVFFDTKLSVSH